MEGIIPHLRSETGPARRLHIDVQQQLFPEICPIADAVACMATARAEARGAVFTRREVVEFILDLADYHADQPLHKLRLIEPSFGGGDFLIPAIERLLKAWRTFMPAADASSLTGCIRAVELHTETFNVTRQSIIKALTAQGISAGDAEALAEVWLVNSDFLLAPLDGPFDVVIGNPPYVRQELIPAALIAEYRARYETIYDRADLYIPFIERSLKSLAQNGKLVFICADRWMKNRYGGPLRQLVAERFHLKAYIDMVNTDAFRSDVIAYPAITLIAREKPGPTRIAHSPAIESKALTALAASLSSLAKPANGGAVREVEGVACGADPWILESSDQLDLLRRLESAFPALEEADCKIGIGVATGADKVFIGNYDALDVEPDRKLPLVMTSDILSGAVAWRGQGVVNPFADDGGLVNLDEYPRLKRYLEARKTEISGRHVAQKTPTNWYRTIDRIYPALCLKPKLLIPDIKGEAHIVFEQGRLYPHHNLYYLTSDSWDLKALQAVLMSGIARLFVSIYSTKMRGGYLRFQAQYLRRIRIPAWKDVPTALKRDLIEAAERRDAAACNRAVFALYGLSAREKAALGGNGD
jgi:hypothetical protein